MELAIKNTITSLELVDQINFFRKEEQRGNLTHNDFLKVIRNEFEEEIGVGKISQTHYRHPQNKQEYPMFILTLSQAKQLLVRESREVRKAVIKYIEELERKLQNKMLPTTYKEALQQLIEQVEENEKLHLENKFKDQQILEMKPKVNYVDTILHSKSLITVTQIAKDYGMSAIKLNDLLHEFKVQYKLNGQWLLYQNYAKLGYTHSETIVYIDTFGVERANMITKWTQKGRLFLYELLKDNDILPLIEQS